MFVKAFLHCGCFSLLRKKGPAHTHKLSLEPSPCFLSHFTVTFCARSKGAVKTAPYDFMLLVGFLSKARCVLPLIFAYAALFITTEE